jgi:hypothetical protein
MRDDVLQQRIRLDASAKAEKRYSAVVFACWVFAHGDQSALQTHGTPDAAASTASHSASVTIAIRPFIWNETAEAMRCVYPAWKAKYLCDGSWTAHVRNSPSGKSVGLKPADKIPDQYRCHDVIFDPDPDPIRGCSIRVSDLCRRCVAVVHSEIIVPQGELTKMAGQR